MCGNANTYSLPGMSDNASGGLGGIRERRLAAGLSQERLARDADCSLAYVRLLEHGYRPDTGEVLGRIAHVLGCGLNDLVHADSVAVVA